MIRATMPEASVDEDRETVASENDIRPHTPLTHGNQEILAEAIAGLV
jgi:hypothetical protein